jgi:hypothetical protein
VTSGALPTGVTLAASTGVISGTTPAIASGANTYSFTTSAIDGENQDTPRNFSITVNADSVAWSSPAANAALTTTVGDIFVQALSATSAAGKSITYTANALPAGLSIVGANITGTPTTAGSVTSLLTATAASTGKTATRTISTTVASPVMAATGGTVTYDGNFKIHTFTTSGTFTVSTAATGANTATVLAVAGGGSGGSTGCGGGAGGLLYGTYTFAPQAYTVTIGAGGSGPTASVTQGNKGSNTVMGAATAIGGGAGANNTDGTSGGSGGGSGPLP